MIPITTDLLYKNDLGSVMLKNAKVWLEPSDVEEYRTHGLESVDYGLDGQVIMDAEKEILMNFLQVHGQSISRGEYELNPKQYECVRHVIRCQPEHILAARQAGLFIELLGREIERAGAFIDAVYAANI